MADQKLVAIHHVSFLVEQLYYLTEQTLAIVRQSLLTTLSHKHGSFALSVDALKKIHQKLKYLNVYEI